MLARGERQRPRVQDEPAAVVRSLRAMIDAVVRDRPCGEHQPQVRCGPSHTQGVDVSCVSARPEVRVAALRQADVGAGVTVVERS